MPEKVIGASQRLKLQIFYFSKIHEKRHWSGAFCLNDFLRARLIATNLFSTPFVKSRDRFENKCMIIAALKSFVKPLEAKCLKKSLSRLRLQIFHESSKISKFVV